MKYYSILFAAVLLLFLTACSTYYRNKGTRELNNLSYAKAVRYYTKSLEKKDDPLVRISLANSYRLLNDVKNAEQEYQKVIDLPQCEAREYFHYGKLLMEQGKYSNAAGWFSKYLEKEPEDVVAKMLLASCRSVSSFMRDTTLYTLKPVELDKVSTSFGTAAYGDGIVFTADKNIKSEAKKNPWTGRSYLDLYFTQQDTGGKWISPRLLSGDVNGQYHEGPATFSSSGTQVYFTRSNYYKHKARKSKSNENNLKIFKATLVDGKWTSLEDMPFNSDEYSCGHPCLTSDGLTLYFVSDMPGGFGGTDIYYSAFNGVSWSHPMNLGDKINTPGNEMFPYMHEDGSLYFASDAHNSMGGLDVFVSSRNSQRGWLRPENLNYPINSSKDDSAFVLNKGDSTGFISSSRSDADKLYQFKKHDPTFVLDGSVKDRATRLPIVNAVITIYGSNGDRLLLRSDSKGNFKSKIGVGSNYNINASNEGYFSDSKSLSTKGLKYSENFRADFELTQLVINKPIVLENIYYDFDKWEIRADAAKELDKLVKTLNDNPDIYIELSSHTDSRAGDQYNLVLSDKRAKAAVQYLIAQGIAGERLTWKGYGESKLLNNCGNLSKCSEPEHQLNRRTEFKVVKIKKSDKPLSLKRDE